jgi:glycerol-3-phosphate acyltransferase PlsY
MNSALLLPGIGIIALGYLLGSIPSGYLVAKARGIDIRTVGSGNIGATNVFRMVGRKDGIFVFLCDAGKGFAAVQIAMQLTRAHPVYTQLRQMDYTLLTPAMAAIIAAVACLIGHSFPLWLGFKGGKAVATSAGVLIGMLPVATLIAVGIWAAAFFTTRYVSLASIIAAIALPIVVLSLMLFGWVEGWSFFYFALAAALLVIWRHRSNIQRLIAGTEHRFGPKRDDGEVHEDVP